MRPPAAIPLLLPRSDLVGDSLPAGALARMGTVRLRHTERVTEVAFSPDGKVLASGGIDYAIRLWAPATGKPLGRFPLEHWVECLAFSPDGKTLAVNERQAVVLMDAGTGRVRHRLRGHEDDVRALAFSLDGKVLASGGRGGTLVLWAMPTGKEIRRLAGLGGSVISIAFSRGGKTVACASGDKTVWLWDAATGKALWTVPCFAPAPPRPFPDHRIARCVAFSPDGKALVVGTSGGEAGDGMVQFRDAGTGRELRRLPGYGRSRGVFSVAFSTDGKTLGVASFDAPLRLWDARTGKQLRDLKGRGAGSIAFSPDGRYLACGDLDEVRLWDVDTGAERPRPVGHEGDVLALAFTADGKFLATLGADNTLRVWEPSTGKQLAKRRCWQDDLRGCDSLWFLPDGQGLAWAPTDSAVDVWAWRKGGASRCYQAARGWHLTSFTPSVDGKLFALDTLDEAKPQNFLQVWDREKRKALRTFTVPQGRRRDDRSRGGRVAFAPDGKSLAAVAHGTVHLWDVRSGKELRRFRGVLGDARRRLVDADDYLSALAFSPDGRLLAAGEGGSPPGWGSRT